ncbi:nicotinate (nicotinamide) nucleotide adenylyltransferase [Vulcanibacillus modesticaldus]|uniref:Probable nicotinate-nucleotide adenylyltransferase n=1 Tax=Vulcanibacillus modesticaldus TaxID=337097 RepID=A0A1D2YTK1_9BACI|nr:nicotinate-nucleotide adenylyltransferase [Vulcanibacillus modesticaldus]OEF99009.1 nicotinate (nicotinamide) nucleotide adenylyltransferase [Vulcanibacillus modesticaldus]
MKKIGILGGTFDPIHIGHLIAADQVLFHAKLDEIWFMPAFKPPHKLNTNITPIQHRLEMLKLILGIDPRYKICTIELERNGPSYTIDTMKELKSRYPDDSFFFIIGGDMIKYLPYWKGIDELLKIVKFIGLERPGYSLNQEMGEEDYLTMQIGKNVEMVPMPQLDISSSMIRNRVRNHREIRFLVPKDVEQYIKEHGLYGE